MGSLASPEFLWGAAVATFGVGDILTTHYGLQQAGVMEAHPLSESILGATGTAGMVAVKVVVIGVALFAAENHVPSEWKVGVPLGLTLLGSLIVANNVSVISRAR